MRNIFFMIAFFIISVSGFAEDLISDPMAFAEEVSKNFAEGDIGDDSGWEGCYYTNKSSTSNPLIQCYGTTGILVHGGYLVDKSFACYFEFKLSSVNGLFLVVEESCN